MYSNYAVIRRARVKLRVLATHFDELMFANKTRRNAEGWYYLNRWYWEITDVRQDGYYPCCGSSRSLVNIDGEETVEIRYN